MNQLSLDDFSLFALIATHRNLSAVAREREVPPSQVSRALARIESRCGAQLVHRTTHGLSLTDDSETFLESAQRVIAAQAELQTQLADRRGKISGLIRIGISQLLAEHVLLLQLPILLRRHPLLRVEVRINDRIVDMATEAVDIVVRAGVPAADTLVAKPPGRPWARALRQPGLPAEKGNTRAPGRTERAHPDRERRCRLAQPLDV